MQLRDNKSSISYFDVERNFEFEWLFSFSSSSINK